MCSSSLIGVFGPNPISELITSVNAFLPRLIVAIVIIVVVAALNQVGIATTVSTPVLIAVLATVGGVIVVGADGGLIKPMQARWEGYLSTAERGTQGQSPGRTGSLRQGRGPAGQEPDEVQRRAPRRRRPPPRQRTRPRHRADAPSRRWCGLAPRLNPRNR